MDLDMKILKESLKPWAQRDTWHTREAYDIRRFHRSLSKAFGKLGYEIMKEDFSSAITELIDECHQGFQEKHKTFVIEEYSRKAEAIAEYLQDVNRIPD